MVELSPRPSPYLRDAIDALLSWWKPEALDPNDVVIPSNEAIARVASRFQIITDSGFVRVRTLLALYQAKEGPVIDALEMMLLAMQNICVEPALTDPTSQAMRGEKLVIGGPLNAGNTCYIDALVTAMFAQWCALDGLLVRWSHDEAGQYGGDEDPFPKQRDALRVKLLTIVNQMRMGHRILPQTIQGFRMDAARAGWHSPEHFESTPYLYWPQEDASEFLAFLLEALHAPYIPFREVLFHEVNMVDQSPLADETLSMERIAYVDIPEDEGPHKLETLLMRTFFDNKIEGLKRSSSTGSERLVDAWKMLQMAPFYAHVDEPGKLRRNLTSSPEMTFRTVVVPIVLKRYTSQLRRKSANVNIPVVLNFSDFIGLDENPSVSERYNAFSDDTQLFALQLRSVVCHFGGESIHSGHYISYVRNEDGSWLEFDDLNQSKPVRLVTRLDEITNLLHETFARNAYIVFFELARGRSRLTTTTDESFQLSPGVPESLEELQRRARLVEEDSDLARYIQASEFRHVQSPAISSSLTFTRSPKLISKPVGHPNDARACSIQ